MNQERIGKFIAERRKNKRLTQEKLAEKLGVSINAISKWERGLCLMDMSLLKPLSEILEVSVNEILAGEKIEDKDIEKKSEENIINLTELVNLKTMKYGIIGMALFFMILVLISSFKGISPSALVSLICAYNAVTFLSRYKIRKDKSDLFAGLMFSLAVICNTFAFIIS
ncbi:MAG: helix-turn-helix domain-containing protein [Bacilli bacterium]|nr:helix-turn-helix domain-containing protein [Bacilli bacterium]